MTENVYGYEVTFDADCIHITFTDLFDEHGEVYTFTVFDTIKLRDALSWAIEAKQRMISPG